MLPFLFLVVPILEIATFVVVGSQIGVLTTIGLVIVTALTGATLLRVQGFATLNRIREQVDRGQVPDRELVHGLMILLAGLLLMTPGFITDTLGLLLFIPAVRDLAWQMLRQRIMVVARSQSFGGFARRYDDRRTIDLDSDEFSRRN